MNPELAQFLIAGTQALQVNSSLFEWQGIPRGEFLWIVTQVTNQEDITEALKVLEKVANGELAFTIPPNLKELVEALEERKQEVAGARARAKEQTEETIRKIRVLLTKERLKEQYVNEVAQQPEMPRPARVTPSLPEKPPVSTTEEGITELYIQATTPITKGISGVVSAFPAQAARSIQALGEEAFGKTPQTANALVFEQIGVTSGTLEAAVESFQKTTPLSERAVVSALLNQVTVLRQIERHPRILPLLAQLGPITQVSHVVISKEPPTRPEKPEVEVKEQGIQTFRVVISRATQQITKFERFFPPPTKEPTVSGATKEVAQTLISGRKNIISQVSIWARKFPYYVGRTLFPQVGRATAQLAVGPGQQLLSGGLRGGFGALGGVGRGTFGFLGRLAGVGGVGGGTTAVGGVAAGVGISGGTVVALVAVAAILLTVILTFFNTSISHQGAYLEQGGLGLAEQNSQFINVEKTATPTVLSNTDLPREVSFEVKVTATEQKLTNITVTNQTTHLKSGGSLGLDVTLPSYPKELQPGESFTLAYTIQVTADFIDSILSDIVTVTADVPDVNLSGETSRGAASVTIGSPPTFCFTFEGPWTDDERAMETEAIFNLARAPTFIKALCGENNGPIIHLVRSREDVSWGGEFEARSSTIKIYNRGLLWSTNATYTLAHEGGHAYANRFGRAYIQFIDSGIAAQEGFIKSYPLGKSTDEDFAEMIGIYPVWGNLAFRGCGGCFITYPSEYPLHYQFARTTIFGGVEY